MALFRTLQGIGRPVALLRGSQGIGAGGASRGGGLFPAFDHRTGEGQPTGHQVLDHRHALKAPGKQQKPRAHTQGTHARQQGAQYMIHVLLGLHAAHRQSIAAASDYGIGRGIGEKMCVPPLALLRQTHLLALSTMP
jgi:hypothetical protein